MRRTPSARLVLLWLLTATAGCQDVQYLAALAQGQFDVYLFSRRIEDVLAGGGLSDERERKLHLVVEIRNFAVNDIGLNAGRSYTMFYDTQGRPAGYSLNASSKSALQPYIWPMPFFGPTPNLMFFDLDRALARRDDLLARGFDTYLYEADAYSTLGILVDPVRSNLLERSEIHLADVIIHELTHNTIWRRGDAEFNESLANFLGQIGALAFLRHRFGPDSNLLTQAEQRYADSNRYNSFMADLYDRLRAYYATPISDEEKTAGRSNVFLQARQRFRDEVYPHLNDPASYEGLLNLPVNNAWVIVNRRYNLDLDLFARVHEAVGEDLLASLPIFAEAARTPDPKAYLRAWLADPAQ